MREKGLTGDSVDRLPEDFQQCRRHRVFTGRLRPHLRPQEPPTVLRRPQFIPRSCLAKLAARCVAQAETLKQNSEPARVLRHVPFALDLRELCGAPVHSQSDGKDRLASRGPARPPRSREDPLLQTSSLLRLDDPKESEIKQH